MNHTSMIIDEAVVGETLSALECFEAARCEPEGPSKSVLQQIADDELRHAELAFETLRWMLATFPELRPLAASAIDEAIHRSLAEAADSGGFSLLRPDARRELVQGASEQVLRPCLRRDA